MAEGKKLSKKQASMANTDNGHPNTLESAAKEAAVADGLLPEESTDAKVKLSGLRRGKWTTEEEAYANRLITEFRLGLLPLTDGTTLRTFLSKLLNCDPMRISKKFVGNNCIGKQVFRRRQQDLERLSAEQIESSRRELAELERRFIDRVAQTSRSKTLSITNPQPHSRTAFDDEAGNGVMPPWMVAPEEAKSNESGVRAHSQTGAPFASYEPLGDLPPEFCAPPEVAAAGPFPGAIAPGAFGFASGFPYPFPSDLQQSGSLPSLSDGEGRNFSSGSFEMYQHAIPHPHSLDGIYRAGSFPWVTPHLSGVGTGGSQHHRISSSDWPSLTNLIGVGDSVENMARLPNSIELMKPTLDTTAEARPAEETEEEVKDFQQRPMSDDVGFPLDEQGSPPTNSLPFSSLPRGFELPKPAFALNADVGGAPSPAPRYGTVKVPTVDASVVQAVQSQCTVAMLTTGSYTYGSTPNKKDIPRNSSIDNFWMLVDMGDLPRPDKDVLSENIWQAHASRAASKGLAGQKRPDAASGDRVPVDQATGQKKTKVDAEQTSK